jgi:hypothetical protein
MCAGRSRPETLLLLLLLLLLLMLLQVLLPSAAAAKRGPRPATPVVLRFLFLDNVRQRRKNKKYCLF